MHNEKEMRDTEAPRPKTVDELAAYVKSLTDGEHDYGTCVYAMSLAAVAAFNHVASQLGVTGFQASCADLDILRRTRRIDGPFMFIKAADALFPQYDLPARLQESMDEWKPWLAEQAAKNLANDNEFAVPSVIEHWKKLAA